MAGILRNWRRILGVASLFLAGIAAAVWVRSLSITDEIELRCGIRTVLHFSSFDGWARIGTHHKGIQAFSLPQTLHWETLPYRPGTFDHLSEEISGRSAFRNAMWADPVITIPLILVSGSLLLSVLRRR